MPLHLVKLCVGVATIDELETWIAQGRATASAGGQAHEQKHTTRMVPKRATELVAGGSLYWVIRGTVQVRQRFLAVRPFVDNEGIGRCHLVLEPVLVPTLRRPMRPFQGWRYMTQRQAPPDLGDAEDGEGLPPALRAELTELGLL